MSQSDLAHALGISQPMVSRLVRRGMPDDVDGARRWRTDHLNIALRKESRACLASPPPPSQAPDDGAEALAHAQRMVDLAAELLAMGKLAAVVVDLRLALRRVPIRNRGSLLLPMALWRELMTDVIEFLGVPHSQLVEHGNAENSAMSDDDAEEAGAFWYTVAAGEFVLGGAAGEIDPWAD